MTNQYVRARNLTDEEPAKQAYETLKIKYRASRNTH